MTHVRCLNRWRSDFSHVCSSAGETCVEARTVLEPSPADDRGRVPPTATQSLSTGSVLPMTHLSDGPEVLAGQVSGRSAGLQVVLPGEPAQPDQLTVTVQRVSPEAQHQRRERGALHLGVHRDPQEQRVRRNLLQLVGRHVQPADGDGDGDAGGQLAGRRAEKRNEAQPDGNPTQRKRLRRPELWT